MSDLWNSDPGRAQDLQPLTRLIANMGHEFFSSSLLECLEHWVQSQHFSMIRLDRPHPTLLMAGTRHRDTDLVWRCWQAYRHYDYQNHDPLLLRMHEDHLRVNQLQVGHMLAEDIDFLPYRKAIYHDNGMNARLSALSLDSQGTPVLFNLYRHAENGFFRDQEVEDFERLAPSLLQLVKGHMAIRGEGARSEHNAAAILRQLCPDLTDKELEVCLLMLKGMTYAGIAAERGVKESTVKTLRNRAFSKLGINYRNQLFAMMSH